ncbi:hypothetical protein [Falsiroseomonas sp. E2-1-a4]|uniref:hypothetical protein n=1 Tax=Falsiroseomonas sp. E2-1-a4 TaxID=3239299 RepID=UPI003F2A168F
MINEEGLEKDIVQMSSQSLINIYEYRLENSPDGLWRYAYDQYSRGKPVEEASEDQGRAVFSASRTSAPGTIPIYQRRYAGGEIPSELQRAWPWLMQGLQTTPVFYELSDQALAPDRSSYVVNYDGLNAWLGGVADFTSTDANRAFWAFPASLAATIEGAVPIYEHRLEVDIGPPSGSVPAHITAARFSTYIKYSTNENGGRVFEGARDSADLPTSSTSWWRSGRQLGRTDELNVLARYTRKIAFHAFPPK